LVLIVVVLIATLVARLITRPIVRLTRTTEQFAAGDLNLRAEVGSRDEIGSLAFGFNTMAEQLQDLVGTLEQRVANSTRDLQTVADVNAQISTVLDENRLLQDVVDLTKERFRLYHAHIYLVNSTGDTLVLTSGAGHVGRQMVSEVRTIAMNNPQSIVANAARSRKGVIINDVTESKTFLPHPLLPDTLSELAVPLIARGQLLGVLDVQSDKAGFFSSDMLSVVELLAGQIAVAISNARLYENAERTSRHERALGNIDRKIQDAVDMDEILQVTVRELGKALRVPYTAIELRLNPNENGEQAEEN
jgi:GAF domain-containing protein/HAMP domain-containing protein